MRALKTAFLHMTNTDTWEEASEKFPALASEEHLCKFMRMDLNKCIPQPFYDFCTGAKLSESESDSLCNSYLKCSTSVACVIDAIPLS